MLHLKCLSGPSFRNDCAKKFTGLLWTYIKPIISLQFAIRIYKCTISKLEGIVTFTGLLSCIKRVSPFSTQLSSNKLTFQCTGCRFSVNWTGSYNDCYLSIRLYFHFPKYDMFTFTFIFQCAIYGIELSLFNVMDAFFRPIELVVTIIGTAQSGHIFTFQCKYKDILLLPFFSVENIHPFVGQLNRLFQSLALFQSALSLPFHNKIYVLSLFNVQLEGFHLSMQKMPLFGQ